MGAEISSIQDLQHHERQLKNNKAASLRIEDQENEGRFMNDRNLEIERQKVRNSLNLLLAMENNPKIQEPSKAQPMQQKKRQAEYHFSDFNFYPDRFTVPTNLPKSKTTGDFPKNDQVPTITVSDAQQTAGLTAPPSSVASSAEQHQQHSSLLKFFLGGNRNTGDSSRLPEIVEGEQSTNNPMQKSSSHYTVSQAAEAMRKAHLLSTLLGTNNADSDGEDDDKSKRSRSKSLGHYYSYFDYSLIPDKDPKWNPPKRESLALQTAKRLPVSRTFSHEDELKASSVEGESNINEMQSAEAARQRLKADPAFVRERKTSAPSNFSFFDYSMIPDKMNFEGKMTSSHNKSQIRDQRRPRPEETSRNEIVNASQNQE